jgi:protoporphyrinogen oxidase
MPNNLILGGGMTGLAAGYASGLPVLEASPHPGGICSSYYIRPHSSDRLSTPPEDGEAYRFEIGGGHWIFGGDPTVLHFIRQLTPLQPYKRKSSVYFRQQNLYVPYPLQNHLRFLSPEIAAQAIAEMANPIGKMTTMEDWMTVNFGQTLCELFFYPFHQLYTAGLYPKIAPQDAYKSPVNLTHAIQGSFSQAAPVGYNVQFVYPVTGLNSLAQRIAQHCDIRYGKQVIHVDIADKVVHFADNSLEPYDNLITTLPLNRMLEMTGLSVDSAPDPYTSVLVLNIGAAKGWQCPEDHWLYNPDAQSGFHRVGFYSNVDRSFLPHSAQNKSDRVSIYVERAFPGGQKPTEIEIKSYADAVVRELQDWEFITEPEVVDPTWIDVAYTWAWPHSSWRNQAMQHLEDCNIYPIGRYARWVFQGIADSIRDGFFAGTSFK